MDKDFIKYSHPANVVYVSQYYVGDLLKTGQFYNNLQTAIDGCQINSMVISYDTPSLYTSRTGINVVFLRAFSNYKIWEGLVSQGSTSPPVVTREYRNDFGVPLSADHVRLGAGSYQLLFQTDVASDVANMRVDSSPISAEPPVIPVSPSKGFIIGADTGATTSAFQFSTILPDYSAYEDDLLSNVFNEGVFMRLTVYT